MVRQVTVTKARLESNRMEDLPVGELLARASSGDRTAWEAIVDRYNRLVWSVVRGFRLDDASGADVTQTVWLRLVEHCDRIRDPERLPGWLAVTARNEALRVLGKQKSQIPTTFEFDLADPTAANFDESLVDDEMQRAALRAFMRLPDESQQLLRFFIADPPLDYATISDLTGKPIGSLGPTRQRILERLRRLVEAEMSGNTGGTT